MSRERIDGEIKSALTIQLDPTTLLSVRKMLFPQGVSVNLMLRYFLERLSVNDPRIVDFISEAKEYDARSKELSENYKDLDAEALYELIALGDIESENNEKHD